MRVSDGRRGAESCVAVAVEQAVVAVVATKHRADRNRRTTGCGLALQNAEQARRSISSAFQPLSSSAISPVTRTIKGGQKDVSVGVWR